MNHRSITVLGIEFDVYYEIDYGQPSNDYDVPDDRPELDIHSVEIDEQDITHVLTGETIQLIREKLLEI